jgi:hypothetical protein
MIMYMFGLIKILTPDDIPIEGSHFETENDYQLLVYYRPVTARWDELVGYRLLNTVKK